MDLGVTNKTGEYYLANHYQKNKAAGAADSTGFLSAISANAAQAKGTETASFADAMEERVTERKKEYGDETIKNVVMSSNPSFGKAMTYEEIMKNWEEQVRINHAKNAKSLAEVMLETDPNAMQKMYRVVNSPKLYTFYEFIRYMEEQIRKSNESNFG